jgi:hypothetical protein
MVGFAELGPTFDFFKEAKSVFRAMCMSEIPDQSSST